jgi:type I restriction enzyme S subunit
MQNNTQTNTKLIPKLRFKEFEEENKTYKFENLFTFSTGKNIKQNEASPEFETPCVRYGELYHMYNEVIYKVINRTNLDKSELLFSKGNEILLPSAGEDPLDIGSASALILENIAIGRTINILRPNEKNIYSQIFVSYYINQKLRKKISTLAKGSSISNVYNSDLKTLKINLPNLQEQKKIASFLTSVNTKIQQLTTKKQLLENYKKGAMQQLFSQQLRFKPDVIARASSKLVIASQSLRGTKQTQAISQNETEFPDWENYKLIDIAKRVIAKNKIDNQNVLTISAQLGLVSQLEYFNKSVSAKNLKAYYLIKNNDFAYNKSYSKGYPMGAIKRLKKYKLGVVSTLYICFRFNDLVSLDFMEQYFEKGLQNKEIEKVAQEGARNHGLLNIGVNDFFEIDLNIPSLKEQQKIATYLSAIDTKIENVQTQIEKTQAFKKGLLQQMFV